MIWKCGRIAENGSSVSQNVFYLLLQHLNLVVAVCSCCTDPKLTRNPGCWCWRAARPGISRLDISTHIYTYLHTSTHIYVYLHISTRITRCPLDRWAELTRHLTPDTEATWREECQDSDSEADTAWLVTRYI